MKKIVNVKRDGFEYDPEFSCNGGSYPQGTISIDFDDGAHIEIEDTSCGDYGSRVMVTLKLQSGEHVCAYYGSMLEADECYSEFGEKHIEYLAEVYSKEGYYIPMCNAARLL